MLAVLTGPILGFLSLLLLIQMDDFRGMTDNAKELLLEAGVFEGRILFNF